MSEQRWTIAPESSETEHREDGTLKRETWVLPLEEGFLDAFLRDVFEQHWPGNRFGPMIQARPTSGSVRAPRNASVSTMAT